MIYIPCNCRYCKEALICTKVVLYHCLSVPRMVELTTLGASYSPSNFQSPPANATQAKVLAATECTAVT